LGHAQTDQDRPKPDLYRDPLRQLAFSDLFCDSPSCSSIAKIQIHRRGQGTSDPKGIQIFREVSDSRLSGSRVQFCGELRWLSQLTAQAFESPHHGRSPAVPKVISPETDLLPQIHSHYLKRLEDEVKQWQPESGAQLLEWASQLNASQAIIRLGRHSQFECTTLDPPYRIFPAKGSGKTRTWVEGRIPLGWSLLSVLPHRIHDSGTQRSNHE
jgi:hypothetical protein